MTLNSQKSIRAIKTQNWALNYNKYMQHGCIRMCVMLLYVNAITVERDTILVTHQSCLTHLTGFSYVQCVREWAERRDVCVKVKMCLWKYVYCVFDWGLWRAPTHYKPPSPPAWQLLTFNLHLPYYPSSLPSLLSFRTTQRGVKPKKVLHVSLTSVQW